MRLPGPARPRGHRMKRILLSLYLCSAAAAAAPGDAFRPFPDLRSLGVEVRYPVTEPCVQHHNMEAIDELGWRLLQLPQVESSYSLASAAREVNRLFSEGAPKFAVLPRNQYVMVQAITPIPTSSRLLNADCSTLWLDLVLAPSAVSYRESGPALLRRQVDPAALSGVNRVLAAERREPRPWARLDVQEPQALLAVVVTARQGSVLEAGTMEALKDVTDEVFFLPGADRSSVKSLFTPDVRWMGVANGGFEGGGMVDPEGVPARAVLERRLGQSWNAPRLVTPDRRGTLVVASLLLRHPETGEKLDLSVVQRKLDSALTMLRGRHGERVQLEAAILLSSGELPRDTRY